jgi:hypothetical protein
LWLPCSGHHHIPKLRSRSLDPPHAPEAKREAPCSYGLSATSQQYFSLRTNQPPAISQQYFFSQNKSAPVISHQPNEQAEEERDEDVVGPVQARDV